MKSQLLTRNNSRTIHLHTDRTFRKNSSLGRTDVSHQRSNSSHSICQTASHVRSFLNTDSMNIKQVKLNTKEIQEIYLKQQFLTEAKMFNPREYFGAAYLTESSKLNIFQEVRRSPFNRSDLKAASYFSVKIQKERANRQLLKQTYQILGYSQSNSLRYVKPSLKSEKVSCQKKKIKVEQTPRQVLQKNKENIDPNYNTLNQTLKGSKRQITISIKSFQKKGSKDGISKLKI